MKPPSGYKRTAFGVNERRFSDLPVRLSRYRATFDSMIKRLSFVSMTDEEYLNSLRNMLRSWALYEVKNFPQQTQLLTQTIIGIKMEKHDLRFRQALQSVKIVKAQGVADISADEFDFLTQDTLWLGSDRSTVTRVLESALYGATDMVGLPRLRLPAEFGAATIVSLVHPTNWQYACHALEGLPWNADLKGEIPDASEIFGLCLMICDSWESTEEHLRTLKENFQLAEE